MMDRFPTGRNLSNAGYTRDLNENNRDILGSIIARQLNTLVFRPILLFYSPSSALSRPFSLLSNWCSEVAKQNTLAQG